MSVQSLKSLLQLLFSPYPKVKGECHTCGNCCRQVTLVHGGAEISTVEEFEVLCKRDRLYNMFIPNEITNGEGVTFYCKNLTSDNLCGVHHTRPKFCREYPSRAMALRGGTLLPGCGYRFVHKESFEEILSKKKKDL